MPSRTRSSEGTEADLLKRRDLVAIVTITMLKSLLLHAGGALLLFQFLVLVTTLPLPREKETHMQLESILDLAETCEQRPAAKVEDSPPESIEDRVKYHIVELSKVEYIVKYNIVGQSRAE